MSATFDTFITNEFGFEAQAKDLFEAMYRRSSLHKAWARITGKKNTLQDIVRLTRGQKVVSSYFQGYQNVPIDAIKGSEGRCEDFDNSFCPRKKHNSSRWIKVASAFGRGVALPPVELIKIGEIFVVRDGHHRISVAKAFGASSVEARVTVWDID
jgi:hypothetical protein